VTVGRSSASLKTGVPHWLQNRRCAAVGPTNVVAPRTRDGDVFFTEKSADRAGSAAEILAHRAPAIARAERRLSPDLIPNRSARDRQGQIP
jgi:hypothetical protein